MYVCCDWTFLSAECIGISALTQAITCVKSVAIWCDIPFMVYSRQSEKQNDVMLDKFFFVI